MKQNEIIIKIKTFETDVRIFETLKNWLNENIQNYKIEVVGTELKDEKK